MSLIFSSLIFLLIFLLHECKNRHSFTLNTERSDPMFTYRDALKKAISGALLVIVISSAALAADTTETIWNVTMPAGAKFQMTILDLGNQDYLLTKGRIFSGRYVKKGNRLVAVELKDARLKYMEWRIVDESHMVLIRSPDVSKIGSDYGGTLARLITATTSKARTTGGGF